MSDWQKSYKTGFLLKKKDLSANSSTVLAPTIALQGIWKWSQTAAKSSGVSKTWISRCTYLEYVSSFFVCRRLLYNILICTLECLEFHTIDSVKKTTDILQIGEHFDFCWNVIWHIVVFLQGLCRVVSRNVFCLIGVSFHQPISLVMTSPRAVNCVDLLGWFESTEYWLHKFSLLCQRQQSYISTTSSSPKVSMWTGSSSLL